MSERNVTKILAYDMRTNPMVPDEPRFLITTSWDDGHPADLRVAALLEKYGVAGTFYVPRVSQRAVLRGRDIRELSRRFEIGGHTLEHLYLPRLSDSEASAQISGSRQWIEDLTGGHCRVFCFPGGKYRSRHLPMVRAAGFLAARTIEFLSLKPPRRKEDLLLIPTTVQCFPHPLSKYAKNALKRFRVSQFLQAQVWRHPQDWLGLANRLFQRALAKDGVFHLWGHSWEIEQHDQWQQLEQFFAAIMPYRAAARFVTNGQLADCRALDVASAVIAAPAGQTQEAK
jgi:peptidoglycan-N-acetylglucosamine deacetylase